MSSDELKELNDKYFEAYPSVASEPFWSGCNYYINQGNSEVEPVGTATSMHDCGGCKHIVTCPLKKRTPIWRHSPEMEAYSDMIAERMKLR